MERKKRSIFENSKHSSANVIKNNEERMFISGDLTSYNLPEELLKERRGIPEFWKGFLFSVFCGSLFIFLSLLIGMTADKSDDKDNNILVTHKSDEIYSNMSYQLNLSDEIDSCWDLNIYIFDSDSQWKNSYNSLDFSIDIYCGSNWNDENNKNPIYRTHPLKLYEYNFEIGVLDFQASEVEINLPFEADLNSNLTFTAQFWNQQINEYIYQETSFLINETNKNETYIVYMPENYENADNINLYLQIKDNETNEILRYDYVGKQSNCWYYGSKCTFTLPREVDIGFIDLNSEIVIISSEEPLLQGLTIQIYSSDYNDEFEDFIFIILWIPPLIFSIAIVIFGINKKYSVLGGAATALVPVLIVSSLISAILFEIFL